MPECPTELLFFQFEIPSLRYNSSHWAVCGSLTLGHAVASPARPCVVLPPSAPAADPSPRLCLHLRSTSHGNALVLLAGAWQMLLLSIPSSVFFLFLFFFFFFFLCLFNFILLISLFWLTCVLCQMLNNGDENLYFTLWK